MGRVDKALHLDKRGKMQMESLHVITHDRLMTYQIPSMCLFGAVEVVKVRGFRVDTDGLESLLMKETVVKASQLVCRTYGVQARLFGCCQKCQDCSCSCSNSLLI